MPSYGWLFDVYPARTRMVVWLSQDDGTLLRLEDPFRPRLYAHGRVADLRRLSRLALRLRLCRRCALTTRCNFWSGARVPVLALEVADYRVLPELRRRLPAFKPHLPPARGNRLIVTIDGLSYDVTTHDAVDCLEALNGFLRRHNPDLILTDHGDTAILTQLLQLARRSGISLAWDREPTPVARRIVTEGRSFVTYGRMLYHPPEYPIYGRWHIDRAYSFVYREMGFAGVVKLARLVKLPMQRVARASIGTTLTSMQLALAVCMWVLIPWHKDEPERWRTASLRLKVDKGGLGFQPPVGAFEHVAELDFSAM